MKRFGNIVYNYFLSQFKQHTRMYYIRPGKLEDLQKFMKKCMEDEVLEKKAHVEFDFFSKDYDYIAVNILRYVHNILTYKRDQEVWNVPEYWQTARTTYNKRTGDCEDGAILILTLARLVGIPANRIFLNAGYVKYRNKKVGHAYVTYLGDDAVEYILDWCYFYDSRRIPTRKRNWYDDRYYPCWFKVNDKFALKRR